MSDVMSDSEDQQTNNFQLEPIESTGEVDNIRIKRILSWVELQVEKDLRKKKRLPPKEKPQTNEKFASFRVPLYRVKKTFNCSQSDKILYYARDSNGEYTGFNSAWEAVKHLESQGGLV